MSTATFALVPTLLAQLAGCFGVSYSYFEAETRPLQALAQREWITAEDEADGRLRIQHYPFQDGQLIPHFREKWRPLAGGAWEQSIAGPDGAVRYSCAARLTANQGRCWLLSTPKPRRDDGRADYSIFDREVTVQVTAAGWVQSERNDKRDEGGAMIANELGWNAYVRKGDDRCPR